MCSREVLPQPTLKETEAPQPTLKETEAPKPKLKEAEAPQPKLKEAERNDLFVKVSKRKLAGLGKRCNLVERYDKNHEREEERARDMQTL